MKIKNRKLKIDIALCNKMNNFHSLNSKDVFIEARRWPMIVRPVD